MKKAIFYIILTIILFSFGFILSELEPLFRNKIQKIMTVDEFLRENNTNRWNELYLSEDGNAMYKGMVIIKNNDHKPLNNETAYTDDELIIYFRADGIRPEEWGCDQSDRAKNGTLGCYLLMPDKKLH